MAAPAQKQLAQALEMRTFAPVYLLTGDDDFRKEDVVRRMVEAALEPSTRDFNLEQRRGPELDAATLRGLLDTPPMMSDRRLVVVRDADGLRTAAREALASYCQRPAADTLVVLVSAAGAKVEKGLAPGAVVVVFDRLTEGELERWITRRAVQGGGGISPEATSLLVQYAGNDLALLSQELEKLAAHANGGEIGVTDVEAVVGVRPGHSLADLMDAVARRDGPAAAALVPEVLAQPKISGVNVVMALATQTLVLGHLAARREEGLPASQLERATWDVLAGAGAYTGRPYKEAVAAWGRAAAKGWWSVRQAEAALPRLHEADHALKESRVSSEDGVLTSLVLSLCG